MTDDTCGEPTTHGEPCSRDPGWGRDVDHGPCVDHADGDESTGRRSSLDERTKEAIYAAVGSGLKVTHVAAAAGVSGQTLRRWTCCIDDLSEAIPDEDPCEFCEGYAQAHANGAREVLEECRPEFRASASFGYKKTERQEVEADVDQTTTNKLGEDEKEIALETIRELQERESA